MFVVEEDYIGGGNVVPQTQTNFESFDEALAFFNSREKNNEYHFWVLFNGANPMSDAIATK